MTISDLFKLMRHYLKLIVLIPVVCAAIAAIVILMMPQTYVAKATLLTNGDLALAGGYAQTQAAYYSQNGVEVTSSVQTAYKTVSVEAEGNDYGGCIAAVNATVLAAADDCRTANGQASVSTNEATGATVLSPSLLKTAIVAFLAGLLIAVCIVVLIDMVRAPIKSRNDIEATSDLPVIGNIPNRDRGERLLANIRFLSDEQPSTIAIVPTGLTGATLTCAEIMSSFERSGVAVSRVQGSPHAHGLNEVPRPGVVTLVECAPICEGMGAVYIARDADMTILCATEWVDSRKMLLATIEELRFAKAKLGGVVFLTGGHFEKNGF